MNIFLTGGAGYIGSAAAEILLRQGHAVTVYDALITGYRRAVPEGARFIQANLSDREILEKTLTSSQFDAVLHFAAFALAGESMHQPGKYFQNNLTNSLSLIEAAVSAGIQRFVFSSTAAVYASSDAPLTEDSPLEPANLYGQTKLMIEQALEWYARLKGLHYAALRYFNAAGALPDRGEDHRPETHLIPLVLQVALGQQEHARIFGTDYPTPDGSAIRDYIHIEDLVSAHLLTLDALGTETRLVYNLGNGEGYSVREVIETSREVTGHPIPTVDTARRSGDAARLVASADKIRHDLGWTPKHPRLSEIIRSAWNWHSSHPLGYGTAHDAAADLD